MIENEKRVFNIRVIYPILAILIIASCLIFINRDSIDSNLSSSDAQDFQTESNQFAPSDVQSKYIIQRQDGNETYYDVSFNNLQDGKVEINFTFNQQRALDDGSTYYPTLAKPIYKEEAKINQIVIEADAYVNGESQESKFPKDKTDNEKLSQPITKYDPNQQVSYSYIADPSKDSYLKFGDNSIVIVANAFFNTTTIRSNMTTEPGNFSHHIIEAIDPYDHLVLYYPFDGDSTNISNNITYDFSNNSYDGQVNNLTLTENGIIGKGYTYNNTRAWIKVTGAIGNNALNMTGQEWTMMAWVNWSAGTYSSKIMGGVDNGGRFNGIGTSNAANAGRFIASVQNSTATDIATVCPNNPNNQTWYHVAARYNSTAIAIIVNGTLCASTNLDLPAIYDWTGDQFDVGSGNAGASPWSGTIDEVMIFNTSLSLTQIQDIINNQSQRFKNVGYIESVNFNLTSGFNRLNVTLTSWQTLLGSNFSLRVGELNNTANVWSYTVYQNYTNNVTFNISTASTKAVIGIQTVCGANQFYCPIIDGNIEHEEFNVSGVVANPQLLVNLISPLNNSNFSTLPILFNITTTNNATAIYTLENGVNNVTMQVINSTNFGGSNSSIADGLYTVRYYANDTFGQINNTITSTFRVDTTVPNITFIAPTPSSGTTTNNNNLVVNVSSADTGVGLKNITIFLFNSTALINTSTGTGSPHGFTFQLLPDGLYRFNSTACDFLNLCNNTETRTITIDTLAPIVTVVSPLNNSYYNTLPVLFNITTNEASSAVYTLNGGITNFSMTPSVGNTAFNASNGSIADGQYIVRFYVNDSAGNFNITENRAFTVDRTNPVIQFIAPTQATGNNVSATFVIANVSYTETNFANISFQIYNTTSLVNQTIFSTQAVDIRWVGLPNGVYTYNVTIVDLAGNRNNTETRRITLDTLSPQFFNLTVTPANGSAYNISQPYVFNVTWTDSILTQSSFIEFNGANFTLSSPVGNIWTFTRTGLGVGVYPYYFGANDSAGNTNITAIQYYTVVKANGVVYTYINHDRADLIVTNGSTVELNGTLIDGLGNLNLTVNGASWNSGASPLYNSSIFTNGTYIINTTYLGNANFSYTSEAWTLTVNFPAAPSNVTTVSISKCLYKYFGYYNTRLPWFRQENCI